MPLWVEILLACSAFLILGLALFRVRYRLDWDGGSEASALLEYGFPGFKKKHPFEFRMDAVASEPVSGNMSNTSDTSSFRGQAGFLHLPRLFRWNANRFRRALFQLCTDGKFVRALLAWSPRLLRGLLLLVNPQVDCDVSHSDPAVLGRWAGKWAAGKIFWTRRVRVHFRFQDFKFALGLQVRGELSALRACGIVFLALISFPWILLMRRAAHSWRHPQLAGWRAFVYARMQSFTRTRPAAA